MTGMRNEFSARSCFGTRFSVLARRWNRVLEGHLSAVGLTAATWAPLLHLKETGGGITQKQLAQLVGVDGSSLVRVIDILVRRGLIERRRDEADGRARLIHLTPRGEAQVDGIRHLLGKAEHIMLADLDDDEIATMLAQFDRIERRLSICERTAPERP